MASGALAAGSLAGTVNLIGSGGDTAHKGRSHEGLCPSGHAGDLGPGLEGLGPGGSILAGGAVIAAEVEEDVDPIVGGEEALSLAGRLEALHLPLSSSRRLMGVFRPVVEMLWGGGDGMARSPPEATDGAPHATAERLEPVTYCSEPGRHLNRSHRDEPIELARRRHRPRDRAPPAEEARG